MRNTRQPRLVQSLMLGAAIGISAALLFSMGFFFRDIFVNAGRQALVFAADENEYFLLTEVQALLDEHYLRQQPPFSERQYAAIRGMLSSLSDLSLIHI